MLSPNTSKHSPQRLEAVPASANVPALKPADLCTSCIKICDSFLDRDVQQDSLSQFVAEGGQSLASIGRRPGPTGLAAMKCPLCCIFWKVATEYFRKYRYHVRLFDRLPSSVGNEAPDYVSPAPFLAVVRENKRLNFEMDIKDEIGQMGLIVCHRAMATGSTSLEPPPFATFNASNLNRKLLRGWLDDCIGNHNECSTGEQLVSDKNRAASFLFFIDCITECVVKGKDDMTFLALSYVWGKAESSAPRANRGRNGEFPRALVIADMPLTIQDAVRFTRDIGTRYLWVDKYCIDPRSHTATIDCMDIIYAMADATIVAIHGEDDDAGLPGVSSVKRHSLDYVRFKDAVLYNSCPSISTLIKKSRWNTRAWTFQEAKLSRRCLVFSKHQVYFVCGRGTRSEIMLEWAKESWPSYLLNSPRLSADDTRLFGSGNLLPGLFNDRLIYSQRNLTYESDALNAFRGVLARCSYLTFWGVPFLPKTWPRPEDANVFFCLGLLWERRPDWARSRHLISAEEKPYRRRPKFPTWSWASVTGEVFHQTMGEQTIFGCFIKQELSSRQELDGKNFPRFEVYSGERNLPNGEEQIYRPLTSVIQSLSAQEYRIGILPETGSMLMVEGQIVSGYIDEWAPHIFWFEGEQGQRLSVLAFVTADTDIPTTPGRRDALILVEWQDGHHLRERWRFLLMLLEWKHSVARNETYAEREGLISQYREEYSTTDLAKIPRRVERFKLY